jgi:hypothetical protein
MGASGPAITAHGLLDLKQEIQIQILMVTEHKRKQYCIIIMYTTVSIVKQTFDRRALTAILSPYIIGIGLRDV